MDDNQLKEYLAAEEADRKAGIEQIVPAYKGKFIKANANDMYMYVTNIVVHGNYVTFHGSTIDILEGQFANFEKNNRIEDLNVKEFDKNTGLYIGSKIQMIDKQTFLDAVDKSIAFYDKQIAEIEK